MKRLPVQGFLDFERIKFGSAAKYYIVVFIMSIFSLYFSRIIQKCWKMRQNRIKWKAISEKMKKVDPTKGETKSKGK